MIRYGGVLAVLMGLVACGPAQTKADACQGVLCGEGRCALVDGAPACVCAEGFRPIGLSCVAAPVADLCASNPCSGLSNSLCLVNGGTVSCVCPTTRVEVNGSCVPRTACAPNPCQQPRRTTCEALGSVASCRCDPGYAPEGDGCSAVPVWTCAQQHTDGDSAEADECPTLAKPLFIDLTESRTLMPSGDHDWFQIGITPGRLFSFSATSANTALLIEVFDATGVTLLASDNRGVTQAEVAFVAPALPSLLVRVRGLRATDTGGYFASYRELGVDDYVNSSAGALTLVPGAAPFAGAVQYAGDLDVVWLELPAQTAVRLALPDGGTPELLVEVSRPDGGAARLINAGEASVIAAPSIESLVLTARGRNPRDLGAFALSLEDLGPDDHSDDPAFGTPLAADNVAVGGIIQRAGDLDSFKVPQLTGRLYRARWLGGSGSLSLTGTVIDANGQLLGSTGYGSNTGQVWEASLSRPAAVRVQPYYSSPGASLSYTVAVEDLGFDDHSDEFGNATPLTHGVAAAGRLELPTDIDTFSFTATAGRIINVAVTNTTPGNTSLPRVRIVDSVGGLVGEDDGNLGVLIGATGTYKIAVSRSYSSGDLITYTVVVTDQGADDHAATSASATALTLGTAASGSVQYQSDVDAFAFTAGAGHLYEITCTRGTAACSYLVKDPAGAVVFTSGYSGGVGVVLAASGGRWVVEVSGGSSYSSTLGPYTLTVSDLGQEDHGGTIATATALTLGAATAGRIGFSQDVDVFSFPVVAGRIYAAQASPSGFRVELRNSGNGLIASSNYNGGASAIAPATGTLYAFVTNYSQASYSLTVEDRGTDDHSNSNTGATALTVGTATPGDIQYQGDLDSFTVPVTTGHHHQVTCTASTGNCALTVQDSLGTTLATTYGATTTIVAFKPPPSVTAVFIRVSTTSGYESARYSIVVADLGADDHGDQRADASALVVDAAATAGALETGSDVDAFTVTPSSGQVVLITCTTTAGTACGLVVTSPAGTTVTQSSPAALSRTAFLATGGAWLVQVRPNSGNGSGSARGSYTLEATRSSDDFTTTSALTLGASQAGSVDYVGDTDVFSIQLTAGTVTRATLSGVGYGLRGAVTSPGGGYVASLYAGSNSTFTASVSGTYFFTISNDPYYGVPASYALTVQ